MSVLNEFMPGGGTTAGAAPGGSTPTPAAAGTRACSLPHSQTACVRHASFVLSAATCSLQLFGQELVGKHAWWLPIRHQAAGTQPNMTRAALPIVAARDPQLVCCAAPAAVVPAQLPAAVAPLPSAFLQVRSFVNMPCQ